jgi:hypothetical protein
MNLERDLGGLRRAPTIGNDNNWCFATIKVSLRMLDRCRGKQLNSKGINLWKDISDVHKQALFEWKDIDRSKGILGNDKAIFLNI